MELDSDVKYDDSTPGYRKVVAKRSIKNNKIVLAEKGILIAVTEPFFEKCCHFCLKEQDAPKRCSSCKFAHYCSEDHQLQDWKAGHKKECALIKKFYFPPNPPLENMTLVLLKIYVQIELLKNERYIEIFKGMKYHKGSNEMKEFIFNHLATNFFEYAGLSKSPAKIEEYKTYMLKFMNNAGKAPSVIQEGAYIASTLGDKASWFNHSCMPNCLCINEVGRGKVIMAIRDVNEGEELTYAYVNILQDVEDRRQQLKAQYSFDCDCPKCKKELAERKNRSRVDISKLKIDRDLSTKCKVVAFIKELEKSVPPYDYTWNQLKPLIELSFHKLDEPELHFEFGVKFTDKYKHWYGEGCTPLVLAKHYLQLAMTAHHLDKPKEALKYARLCLPVYEQSNDHESMNRLQAIVKECQ